MSKQAQEQDLTPTMQMQEMMAQMAQMRAELDSLKGRTYARAKANNRTLPQTTLQAKPEVSTTRRKLLRRVAGGLVAGLAVSGIGVSLPQNAEAKISSNPATNGLANRAGMLVVPPGTSVINNLSGGTTKVGLVVSSDNPTFDISVFTPTVNAAILASTSGNGTAIVGQTVNGTGVYGQSISSIGVSGSSSSGSGVYGKTTDGSGVSGFSNNAAGVYGNSDNAAGVYGNSANGYSGFFVGSVHIGGRLDKPAGSFKIDHPLDPDNKYLYHSFVESPDMMNIYNGIVVLNEQGEATVEMPDWFEALNSDFRYQLTSIGGASPNLHISEKLAERKFKIAGGLPGQEVSWMVTGIRQDAWAKAHRIPVEEAKTDKEKGKYLHPELFGQPEEMSVHPRPDKGDR